MALQPASRLGPYEIVAPLGAGGMGEVYRARDSRLDRTVAIKVLPDHHALSPEARDRFHREAHSISQLNHPHICTLFDVGHDRGIDFLVMEYVEGETLAARMQRGRLPIDEAISIAAQVADALAAAHHAGIIHRDVKPANIILTHGGARLLDFGLAKSAAAAAVQADAATLTANAAITGAGTIVGTFAYMAPEQVEGGDADRRTDIWALGCVLHEMVTGTRTFEARSKAGLIAAILEREPAPMTARQPLAPASLERLVRRCLSSCGGCRHGQEHPPAGHSVTRLRATAVLAGRAQGCLRGPRRDGRCVGIRPGPTEPEQVDVLRRRSS